MATTPRRGPAPQPAGGSGLDTVEGGGRAPEPVFLPGAGPGATPRRGHGDHGVGGDRARHGMQVDHCGCPAAIAIATGVPAPPTGGPRLGPPPCPHKGSVEGRAEPPQRMDDEPGCTVPAGAGARAAHGPHNPEAATPCTGRRPLRSSSPTRCWTWLWSRCGCSTCRPISRLRARQTAWAASGCSAASRPHSREAWWNSG